jgi:pimeloyl-ACP methyl ester carboxylesterase
MTVEQFVADRDELVDAVCERLGKTEVAIFGHSCGSVLGPLYAARFPDKVEAYVGSGQIGDWAAAESATYAFAVAEAERLGKRAIVTKLRAIGPPPHTATSLWTQRTCLSRLEGRMRPRALWSLARAVLAGKESSVFELPTTMRRASRRTPRVCGHPAANRRSPVRRRAALSPAASAGRPSRASAGAASDTPDGAKQNDRRRPALLRTAMPEKSVPTQGTLFAEAGAA